MFEDQLSYFRDKTEYMMLFLLIMLTLFLLSSHPAHAQKLTDVEAIMNLLGSDDPDEIDSDEVERLEELLSFPVRINKLEMDRLRSCGLFSTYQIAVLKDYVINHGHVKSISELSLLDGFGEDFARKVAPFVDLETENHIHPVTSGQTRHELASRGGFSWREDAQGDWNYAMKYRMDHCGKITAVVSASRSSGSSSWLPSSFSGSLKWQMKHAPVRLTAGDFNARFGQGLVLWNNVFINNLTTPDTFMKKPGGITQPWSFTGNAALSGIAADCNLGHWVISAVAAFPGIKTMISRPEDLQFMPALNVSWFCRHGHVSLTNQSIFSIVRSDEELSMKSGLDASFCLRGINIFGELAFDWIARSPVFLLGSRFACGEYHQLALQTRMLEGGQYGTSLAGSFSFRQKYKFSYSADLVYYSVSKDAPEPYSAQLKTQLVSEIPLTCCLDLKLRWTERVRTWGRPFRTDLRADLEYDAPPFAAAVRLNVLNCDNTGLLSYLEAGYVSEMIAVYLRQGLFFVDDWDDRIYVYERDAPGSFNSPAMYGRGVWTSLVSNVRIASSLRLYFRGAYMCYPFMEKKKPGKAELKLQLQYRF